jgi:hypothetical protein
VATATLDFLTLFAEYDNPELTEIEVRLLL